MYPSQEMLDQTTAAASPASPVRETFERDALPYLDAMYNFALRLSGDPTEAEDLVQDSMLKAFRFWHRYQSGTNLRAWLLTILRNTFLTGRRDQRFTVPTVDVTEVEPYSMFEGNQELDPEGRFFDELVDEEVVQAVDGLPEEFREVVVLSDFVGLPYREIAAVVGVPVGTVKSRMFRARRLLYRELYDYASVMGYVRSPASAAA